MSKGSEVCLSCLALPVGTEKKTGFVSGSPGSTLTPADRDHSPPRPNGVFQKSVVRDTLQFTLRDVRQIWITCDICYPRFSPCSEREVPSISLFRPGSGWRCDDAGVTRRRALGLVPDPMRNVAHESRNCAVMTAAPPPRMVSNASLLVFGKPLYVPAVHSRNRLVPDITSDERR